MLTPADGIAAQTPDPDAERQQVGEQDKAERRQGQLDAQKITSQQRGRHTPDNQGQDGQDGQGCGPARHQTQSGPDRAVGHHHTRIADRPAQALGPGPAQLMVEQPA